MLGRVTLFTIETTGGVFYYITQRERNPGPQVPHDPSKKNIVVVGSGWGSTMFLKKLDTSEYNVTVIASQVLVLMPSHRSPVRLPASSGSLASTTE